ncbi:uncharacterized protein LOC109839299 [Asparagus officinalis]|uniref:uncharacterized protein LOC109839299 n=1 Tax=Asparagus officinalis TaxID=4686 RepID=UPI00098E4B8E|nr:uncharacterized protein LOC109839299 [Asparagus officinalis]
MKPIQTPLSTSTKLTHTVPLFNDLSLYLPVVSALQYATLTRPDLAFAVNKLHQFMSMSTINHWQAVQRNLRYLMHTISHGLFISKSTSLLLHEFSNASWAGCPVDQKSSGGYAIFLGNNLISYSAHKQRIVARSSTESEYDAFANAATELIGLCLLINMLQVPLQSPLILWCDNLGAIYVTDNPIFHTHTKHIEVDFHFIRDQVAKGWLNLHFVSMYDQLADIMTRPLTTKCFAAIRDKHRVHCCEPSGLKGHDRVCCKQTLVMYAQFCITVFY